MSALLLEDIHTEKKRESKNLLRKLDKFLERKTLKQNLSHPFDNKN